MGLGELFGFSTYQPFLPRQGRTYDPGKRSLRTQISTREELSEIGKKLATEHRAKVIRRSSSGLYARLRENFADIEHAYVTLSDSARKKESLTPGAEWLLDNYHVIEKQINDIRKQFPRGYDRTLPKLIEGDYATLPRVYHIAIEFMTHTDSILDIDLLNSLIEGYQTISILSIGEVWAIPIMIRFALLDNLRNLGVSMVRAKDELKAAESLIDEILGDESRPGTQILLTLAEKVMLRPDFLTLGAAHLIRRLRDRGRKASLTLQWLEERLREEGREPEDILKSEQYLQAADQISIGNTFTSLRAISYIDWAAWFESTSRIEHLLRLDPGGLYPVSDFKTRDKYRHVVEEFARHHRRTEREVAEGAIALARRHQQIKVSQETGPTASDRKQSSIGYYLSRHGLPQLEKELQVSPPLFTRFKRLIIQSVFSWYVFSIVILTIVLSYYALSYALSHGAGLEVLILTVLLFLVPASDIANDIVQWFVCHLTRPYLLPKLDLDEGVPDELRTAAVVHALFADKESVKKTIDALHVRFLANQDENVIFGILADFKDASAETIPDDDEISAYAHQLIEGLKADYQPHHFFVLFRKRLWNQKESVWMAWERKRGKIEEFNRLLLGDESTTFLVGSEDKEILRKCRYVITLDNDTQLPRGTASKLIAAIAHPMNAPVIDEKRGVVVEGYGIIQPRVGVSLTSANASQFALIFSGHAGLDPYTQTVSDVYQDLFGEGSFIGKGIYDVRAFEHTLGTRVPENSLLSHDLFEGLFARVALATDIELFDDFPSKYHVHAKRQHRWIRGDWQLLPWTKRSIPVKSGPKIRTPISGLGRWKLIDNLRRSLVAPSVLGLIVGGCTFLPGNPLFWILLSLLAIAFPVYANLAQALMIPPRGLSIESHLGSLGKNLYKQSKQALLTICFLPHQAYLSLHAIIVTLYRIFISKKHLLQWETAYHSERRLGHNIGSFIVEMSPALLLAAAIGAVMYFHSPHHLFFGIPFVLAWLVSPVIASKLSEPKPFGTYVLSSADREYLYGIAHDTWRYFHDHMNERNNYLVPDNIQLVPEPVVAERTSPTNISLSMLTTVSAFDCGFLSVPRTASYLARTFGSLKKLERFGGHFLNWYGTATLEALHPRYVSMVDSGNMVGHLIALNSALQELHSAPLFGQRHFDHVNRSLRKISAKVSDEVRRKIDPLVKFTFERSVFSYRELFRYVNLLGIVRENILAGSPDAPDTLFLEECSDFASLHETLAWIPAWESLSTTLRTDAALKSEIEAIEQKMTFEPLSINGFLSIEESIRKLLTKIKYSNESVEVLSRILEQAHARVTEAQEQLTFVRHESDQIIEDMDFSFLFDYSKNLFVIGYNVDAARKDSSFYDLFASEARLGSLVAVALGQIPQRHWFSLGRGLTNVDGGKALLSWTGTMFEYLMPALVMKDFPGTLLSETYQVVVKAQRAYTRKFGVPWGISESGYSGVDFEKTYQYKAFGVPGLGLKRGLEEDLVISPYSTFLALQIDAQASLQNTRHLEREGIRGAYGFYEAVDYTTARLAANEKFHIVQNFLAHHQGMSVVAINNVLHNGIFPRRFHRDARVQSAELLLHEKFPERLPAILPQQLATSAFEEKEIEEEDVVTQVITTPHTSAPRTHLLSNGHFTTMVDNSGSGFTLFDKEMALTRWKEDLVSNDMGTYVFLRDLESDIVWSPTFQPTLVEPLFYEVVYGPDKAEFKRRDFEIYSHLEITISPEDDVEIRRLTLANLSMQKRSIEITSFAEVALAPVRADSSHPAFSKMFVESEFLEDYDALMFSRRPRSKHEEKLHLLHMVSMRTVWDRTQYETSREAFLGRGRTIHNPHAFTSHAPLRGNVGYVLDPVMSLRVRVELMPGESQVVTFLTGFSKNRDQLLQYANRYRDTNQVQRAFEMAWSQSSIELRNERTYGKHAHTFQRLANALMFNIEKTRPKPDVVVRNRMGQSGLWRFGISGDLPICLARITEPNQTKLVEELLQAHHYLRTRGFQFDLVVFNEHPGGYMQNSQEELEFMVRASFSGGLIDKKGGVFLRNMLQLSEEEKDLVQAVSRVSLSGLRGNLATQLKFEEPVQDWLSFDMKHQAVYSLSSRIEDRDSGEFFNGSGGFVEDGRAYRMKITSDSLPPAPWSNVIATPEFGTLITETGSGYTWSGNSRENRLTPWSNDPVTDPAGEILYIRDVKTGAYWCPTPRPVLLESDVQVIHKFGETIFKGTVDGISSELSVTVSSTDPVKLWGLTLSNLTPSARTLEIFLYVNWVLGVQRQDTITQLISGYDKASGVLWAQNHYNIDFAGRVLFMGANRPIESYTTSRAEFLGRNRDSSSPIALEAVGRAKKSAQKGLVKLSQKVGACFDSCGVIKIIVNVDGNANENISFFMGEMSGLENVRKLVPRLITPKAFSTELEKTRDYFRKAVTAVEVKTPERGFDIMMNGWLLYQTLSCRISGRTGFYQSGGAYGFRDQLQDSLSLLISNPALVRRQILLHASRQFPQGDVQHWWHPPTGKGVRTRICDDYLWLPLAVERYIEVTGDTSILDEHAGFIDGPLLQESEMEAYIVPHSSNSTATIYEKCLLCLDRSFTFGSHGLPLMGGGDWNDGMNEIGRHGKGESVWMGWFISYILKKFIPIVEARGDSDRVRIYSEKNSELKKALEDNGWDGKWYRRAYFDDGSPVGSASQVECKIDSLSQSWSIISGTGDPARSNQAMHEVYEHLVDKKNGLIRLLFPPFDSGPQEPGYIKGYLPGIRENGGQYTHAAAWVVIAAALLGDGERAESLFRLINPIHHTQNEAGVMKYRGEPYVLCGDVYSVPPYEGRAGWSWYTGSSGWMYQAGIEYIIGLKVRATHFTVDPCVPPTWKEFSATLHRGTTTYKISISNPSGVSKGVSAVQVDGQSVSDGVIHWAAKEESPRTVDVRIIMGARK